MPINKIRPTKRAAAMIAAVMLAFSGGAYGVYDAKTDTVAVEQMQIPAAVFLAVELIKPWEGIHLNAYRDVVGVPTICWGETKGVKMGMRKTREECDRMLIETVYRDYYLPISKSPNFLAAPDSVQASMISGAYNFGVHGWLGSTAARKVAAKDWPAACEAQTAWNKAGGKVWRGLVNRREMGDATRIGEAELCKTGIPK